MSGGIAIRKEFVGPDAARRAQRERSVLEHLAGVPGVVGLIGKGSGHSLLLGDADAVSPAEFGRWELPELLRMATQIATAVAEMHDRGVTHRDINPSNIVRSDAGPLLIDFDLATTTAEERPGFLHQLQMTGTLAYLPPEQTGRTGRTVDQRADLYSLGATFYELITGEPPFGTGDALRLVHDHLTRLPEPPHTRNPAVPPALSRLVLRLLEKDPDRRYQSARGVVFDLARLEDLVRTGRWQDADFRLGERDFPRRLLPPSRLVGRDREVAALAAAFAGARRAVPPGPDGHPAGDVGSRSGLLLISGVPGVGKSRLVNELRPLVTGAGGWLVGGKFDAHRSDLDGDAVRQCLRGLCRLLLAEPDGELSAVRDRLRARLARRAGATAEILPELRTLLGVAPVPTPVGDPQAESAKLVQDALGILTSVATPARPIVMVLDDVQWAGPTPLELLDAMASVRIPNVLVVAAYRADEVDAAHPLTAIMSRWRRLELSPPLLELVNLPAEDLGVLLAEVLRMPVAAVADLAAEICASTGGNPFDSVELLNQLCRDGAITLAEEGWRWDPVALHRRLRGADVIESLTARIDALPGPARRILGLMSVLGGEIGIDLLEHATGEAAATLTEQMLPAMEDGLLVTIGVEEAIAFVHDRVQQAAAGRLTDDTASALRLQLARRLAAVRGREALAVAQYLPVLDAVTDPAERAAVAVLCRRVAAQARLVSDFETVERLLAAAQRLGGRDIALAIEQLTALFCLGRLAETDDLYAWVVAQPGTPGDRAAAAGIQIGSLTARSRPQEAVALGRVVLCELGLHPPAEEELDACVAAGMDIAYEWVRRGSISDDLARPELDDSRLRAIAEVSNRTLPAAYFCDHRTMGWLVVECVRLWAEHGPAAALVGPVSHLGFVASALRDDYRIGRDVLERVIALGEARGYEPDTSQARFLYALGTGYWFEPAEDVLAIARQAHDGAIRWGDLRNACYSFYVTIPLLLEHAATLAEVLAETDIASAFCARTGNDHAAHGFIAYRQAALAMTGTPDARPDRFGTVLADPVATANLYRLRALVATLFDDVPAMVEHTTALMPLLPGVHATPIVPTCYFLRALTIIRHGGHPEELAACRTWLTARVADAPANFAHLLHLLDAEQHRAADEYGPALRAYDRAVSAAAGRRRPWHQALITERAGRYHLALGLRHSGQLLLTEAHHKYEDWGATAKTARLVEEFAWLGTGPAPLALRIPTQGSVSITSDAIDLLGILAASQALSSETNLDRLRERMADVLAAMTGATATHIAVWNEPAQTWWLLGTDPATSLEQAGEQGLFPLSAFRYAERSGEPLVVENACDDPRFTHDPYLAGLEQCSLLAVPIRHQGAGHAVLVLCNSLSRAAFTTERLGGVQLIAGQLAVSLANAQLYASLESTVAARTAELAEANRKLERLTLTDPLTGLANRRLLANVLESEWQRAQRPKSSLAVAMIDIDHFKLYNDHYGHTAGDSCLRRVADVLTTTVRTSDTVARYGGEEFAVVFPDTDASSAYRVAERARAAIADLGERHAAAPTGIVTVSIGVAAVVPSADGFVRQLIDDADQRLYAAKREGRNRVSS
ncbi:diguanylate cyclase [Cryptosporangium sp. NPDC051539]|uniref:diguanylate cyclase n=1 Tax=Cryptosporangium sp. NPDC051539 TaxID=3363962 RepID=UPI0037B5B4FA